MRGAAFIYSPLLKEPGREYNGLMHVTDWLPTFIGLAKGESSKLSNIDGYNQWDSLQNKKPSPRSEILLNIRDDHPDEDSSSVDVDNAALRLGDWKLIQGQRKSL